MWRRPWSRRKSDANKEQGKHNDGKHGTYAMYENHKCRCQVCKDFITPIRREYWQRTKKERLQKSAENRLGAKLIVLAYYGKEGKLQCSWPDCDVTDIDMLTIDHVNNDGNKDYRNGGKLYVSLRANGYPEGFQTLCHNHQWKKEMMRRRNG